MPWSQKGSRDGILYPNRRGEIDIFGFSDKIA
jgi:hypothetical protein